MRDFDDYENSSAHGEDLPPLSTRNALPPSESGEPDDNSWELRERDAVASNAGSIKKSADTDGDGSIFSAVKHGRTSSSLSEIAYLKQRLRVLEQQATSSSNNDETASRVSRPSGLDSRNDLGIIFENGSLDSSDQQQIIPQMCERTWSDFMNKSTSENSEYAVEVLNGKPEYYKKTVGKTDRKHGKSRGPVAVTNNNSILDPSKKADERRSIPDRIRINSTLILKTLKEFDEHIDATASLVMLRPYKFLVHYDVQIRESIRNLEHQIAGPDSTPIPVVTAGGAPFDSSLMTHEVSFQSEELKMRRETLQHMLCLSSFMDQYVNPTLSRLEDDSNEKIRFSELWYIFKPGVDIHMPLKTVDNSLTTEILNITPETFQTRYNQCWRVTGTSGGRPNLTTAQNRNVSLKSNPFKVDCYYIDFHRKYFRPTVHTFEITPFKGERDITDLDFYPSRCMKVSQLEQTLKGQVERGNIIYDSLKRSFTHFFYDGPTLMVHPCGCPLKDGPATQEHIESEVIVDFKMALGKHPSWQPEREPWKDPVIERRELQETFPVQYWTDPGRNKLGSSEYDQVYNDYFIDRERATTFRNNEQIFSLIPSGAASNEDMVPEKDGKLLPGRVLAFVLRTRTFAPIWTGGLQQIKAKMEGLDNLQLKDNSFKDTLQALVKTHFAQNKTHNSAEFDYDIVRGKGRGLVLLLHGAPGVGKTFTAESVAAANGQPLLQITSGDLGLKPKEVDAALKEIFHYAQHWKCVLLLDECDIFLTQRNKTDIKRNALVSIFLRVLEFYTGVLFLTTNRVGALDEAIKSRITWISYYPPLNWTQTKEIWKTNIRRVEKVNKNLDVETNKIMKYAKQHFKVSMMDNAVWNGRRIHNAFKVATALADWDTYSAEERGQTEHFASADHDGHPRSKLTAAHFMTYAEGTRAFDTYIQEATGSNDADRAYHAMERADDFAADDGSTTPIISPGYDRVQIPTFMPQQPPPDLRRTSSASLAPASATVGRTPSPGMRPHMAPRNSSSQIPSHHRSPTSSRQGTFGTSSQTSQSRRLSSGLNALSPPHSPITRRRPSNEHRGSTSSLDHESMRRGQSEPSDTGLDTDDTDEHFGEGAMTGSDFDSDPEDY